MLSVGATPSGPPHGRYARTLVPLFHVALRECLRPPLTKSNSVGIIQDQEGLLWE